MVLTSEIGDMKKITMAGSIHTNEIRITWFWHWYFFISIPVHSKVVSTVWGNVAHGKHGLIEKAGDMKHISYFTAWVASDQKL